MEPALAGPQSARHTALPRSLHGPTRRRPTCIFMRPRHLDDHPHLPPTERSPVELMLVRAMEDLLTVAPIELALTETMGVLL